MKFEELGLSVEFLRLLESMRFEKPTDIQAKTIPLALEGKDVIGGSATGSGKTLAFGASIIENAVKGELNALILTPTRELAEQVGKSLRNFSRWKGLHVAMVYGGVSLEPQVHEMRRAEIVVGTPGRILDHLERGSLDVSKVRVLVLDEADKMLDMGFIDDVQRIIQSCRNPERQTLLFSATISSDITRLAKKYMKNPVEVAVETYVDPSLLTQVYYDVPQEVKFSLLVHLLRNEEAGLVMVFCNTRRNVDIVAKNLENNGIEALAIHGGLTQARRNKIMEKFHSARKVYVLVCTDVAARGLDIKNVSHVYNYDLPVSSKEYVHRIGRTARAGKEGKAISLVSNRDYENFRNILRDESMKIFEEKLPSVNKVHFAARDNSRGSFRGGGRGGFRGRDRVRRTSDSHYGGRDRPQSNRRDSRRSFGGSSGARRYR